MNITEANAWNQVLRGLETSANEDQQQAGRDAAFALAQRARKALGAGPTRIQAADLIAQAQDAVSIASDHDDRPVFVELGGRPVETHQPTGGLL